MSIFDHPLPGRRPGGNVAGMKFFLASLVALAVLVFVLLRFSRGRIPADGSAASGVPTVAGFPAARKSADIHALSIKLDVDNKSSLFFMLASDGTINRMGSGTMEDPGGHLFIGKIDPAIFEALRSQVTEAMLGSLGQTFQHQNPRGLPCKLTLSFQFQDGTWNGLAFLYGSESEGMPKDVADYVTAAVRQTDPWYENFRRIAAQKQS